MSVYYSDETLTLLLGKAESVLPTMDAGSVDCVVTSPPYYGLRDYEGNPDQIGLEETPGTTALAAQQLGRRAIGIDINAAYHDIALKRMSDAPLPFGEVS